jgi:hypothetical protein
VYGNFTEAEYEFQVLAFAGNGTLFNWLDFPIGWATNASWHHFMSTYTATPNLDAGWRRISQTDAQRTVLGPVGAIQSGGNALTASVPGDSPLFVGFYQRATTTPVEGTTFAANLPNTLAHLHLLYETPTGARAYRRMELDENTIRN